MRGLAKLGVDITCVHAGGIRMMEAAMRGLTDGTPEGEETTFTFSNHATDFHK